jgi:dTDP-glucose pyrophosphorylase
MEIKKLLIERGLDLKSALKRLDQGAKKVLFVVEGKQKLYGSITDGDIRRFIIKTGGLSGTVDEVCHTDPVRVKEGYGYSDVKQVMLEKSVEAVPVVNSQGRIIDILYWEDILRESDRKVKRAIDLPVVIMAGGRGTRLEPFTQILPKPLIPVGDKTMIELVMKEYLKYGVTRFIITLNYKSELIKAYLGDIKGPFQIQYIDENKPLGTGGGLYKLKDMLKTPFLVTNCDVLIDTDIADLIDFHKDGGYLMTLVASMQHYKIPYGICQVENGGLLTDIQEKPEYDFLVNTGLYMLNPDVLKYLPENTFFPITDLVKALKKDRQKIGVYPVSEKSFIDIGQLEEYKRFMKLLDLV